MNNIDNSNSYKVTFELQDSEDEISTEAYAQNVIQLFVIFFNNIFVITGVIIYAELTIHDTLYHIPFQNVSTNFYNIT